MTGMPRPVSHVRSTSLPRWRVVLRQPGRVELVIFGFMTPLVAETAEEAREIAARVIPKDVFERCSLERHGGSK